MTIDSGLGLRLRFLGRVIERETRHLQDTDQRLFGNLVDPTHLLGELDSDPILAERIDAFVSRFGRLQDTLADKLIPSLLDALGEPRGAAIDNLDRAERFGWIESTEAWFTARRLRKQMIHEYIEDRLLLLDALQAGHAFVPTLIMTATHLLQVVNQRLGPPPLNAA